MLYRIAVSVVWVVWHLVFRIRTVGREKVHGLRRYVLCANHCHAVDPVFVVVSRASERQMVVMAKEELFQIHPFISWFFRAVGAVPVSRGKGDTRAVDQCIEEVRNGKGLLIFPEGTRSHTGQPGKVKSGAFVVAAAAGASLVPCRIVYDAGGPRLFSRVTIIYGDPVPCEELGLADGARSATVLRRAKNWLLDQWQQLYLDNTTPAQQQADLLRAQSLQEAANGDH